MKVPVMTRKQRQHIMNEDIEVILLQFDLPELDDEIVFRGSEHELRLLHEDFGFDEYEDDTKKRIRFIYCTKNNGQMGGHDEYVYYIGWLNSQGISYMIKQLCKDEFLKGYKRCKNQGDESERFTPEFLNNC
jgi:hypothetical protein